MLSNGRIDVEGTLEVSERAGVLSLRNQDSVAPADSNLSLADPSGNCIWEAQQLHPLDKWVHVAMEKGRLFATSFGGWRCELDVDDGRIISTKFVK